jgi:Xaa-Pro aminopeptidase
MDQAGRTKRAREAMATAGCDALLVSNLVNVRYLTGFSGSAGMLLIRPDDAILVTDGRYATQAPAELARAGAVAEVRALPAADQLGVVAELTLATPRVGLEADHITWGRQRHYVRGWARGRKLVATTGLVEGLRQRKDAGEVARIAGAAAIADRAFASVCPMLEQGLTEAEVALALDTEMRRLGAEAPAFDTIVASGPNGAEPHHRPSSRPVAPGDLVVLDFGARVEGYCSDMTRTVRAGGGASLPDELRRVVTAVLASQDAGLSAVRDGARGSEVDRACREVVEAAGWGDFFMHGTGHGVGLDIHEAPSLARPSKDILCSGHVVTVEPGVYIPGLGGARTEDTVVVTDAGCEVLTLTPKQAQLALGTHKHRDKRTAASRSH